LPLVPEGVDPFNDTGDSVVPSNKIDLTKQRKTVSKCTGVFRLFLVIFLSGLHHLPAYISCGRSGGVLVGATIAHFHVEAHALPV